MVGGVYFLELGIDEPDFFLEVSVADFFCEVGGELEVPEFMRLVGGMAGALPRAVGGVS